MPRPMAEGELVKKSKLEDANPESLKTSGRPKPKRRRKELFNTQLTSLSSDVNGDDGDCLSQQSSVSSKDQAPISKSYKTSRGIPDRSNHVEKQPSIEDAVFVYRTVMNSSSRPPIFLQRNLVYLPQTHRASTPSSSHVDFEKLVEKLSSVASVTSTLRFKLTSMSNLKIGPLEKKEIRIEISILKNCYKRRKTDVASKEKFIKSITLNTPLDNRTLEKNPASVEISEITSSIGAHHMSSSYLKAKVTVASERRGKSTTSHSKKTKKKYYMDVPEQKYDQKQYVSTLLLYSGGKYYFPNGKKTLFLHPVEAGNSHINPQFLDWNDLSSAPQLILETSQHSDPESSESKSTRLFPMCTRVLSNRKTLEAKSPAEAVNGELSNGVLTNGNVSPPINPSTPVAPEKLYFVMQCKGSAQTTVQFGLNCPFCLKKTRPANLLYLLKHLRLCHNRLLFLYKEADGDPAIIVTVNTYFDGSYCGNPLDIIPTLRHSKTAALESFKRTEPMRRIPYTEVLNVRANRKKLTLEEFSRPEPLPLISNYSSLLGHNRLYHHSVTNQPILSNDFDTDSEGEDTEWMRTASSRLIDEFIDVNKGEKELMKMWNNFISKNSQYISDIQMEGACLKFVREHSEYLSYKLRNNFLCHLATLYDSGVLQVKHVKTIIEAMPKKPPGPKSKPATNGILTCSI